MNDGRRVCRELARCYLALTAAARREWDRENALADIFEALKGVVRRGTSQLRTISKNDAGLLRLVPQLTDDVGAAGVAPPRLGTCSDESAADSPISTWFAPLKAPRPAAPHQEQHVVRLADLLHVLPDAAYAPHAEAAEDMRKGVADLAKLFKAKLTASESVGSATLRNELREELTDMARSFASIQQAWKLERSADLWSLRRKRKAEGSAAHSPPAKTLRSSVFSPAVRAES